MVKTLFLDHFNEHGGAQEYLIDIANGFSQEGYTGYLPLIDEESLEIMVKKDVPRLPFHLLSKSPRSPRFYINMIKNIIELKRWLKSNKIDIIQCNSVPVLLIAKAVAGGRPIVYTYHIGHSSAIKRWLIQWSADAFVFVSNAMMNEANSGGNSDKPYRVIYNGVPTPKITKRESGATIFGIPGRITKEKGIPLFIEAVKKVSTKLKDAEFHIIGRCSDPKLEELIKDATNEIKNLKLIPFFKNKDDLYSSIDVVVNATIINEPLGRTLIEAGLSKLPVIGPDSGGPTEIVVHNETGILFKLGDSDSLADAMIKIGRDRDLRESMGEKGYDHCMSIFSVKGVVDQLFEFFNSLRS